MGSGGQTGGPGINPNVFFAVIFNFKSNCIKKLNSMTNIKKVSSGYKKNEPVWPKSQKATRILPKAWGSFSTFKIFGKKWSFFVAPGSESPRGLTRYLAFFFFGRRQRPQRRRPGSPLGLVHFSGKLIRRLRTLRALRVFRFRAIRAIRARGSFFFSCCCS